jgi:hypothetical protein
MAFALLTVPARIAHPAHDVELGNLHEVKLLCADDIRIID